MALIYCSECGTEMSDQAYACPKCAHPVPQVAPLQPVGMAPQTPFYFSTPFIIICLVFCPLALVGLLLMWVGRVWTTAIRTVVTLVYAGTMIFFSFIFFYAIHKTTEQAGKPLEMFIEEMQNVQPPPDYNPREYYEEYERGDSSQFDDYQEEPAQLTPAAKSTAITIERWTWVNQASPPGLKIEGTVRNSTSSMFQNLKVYVTAEDGNRKPSILKAGGTSNFVVVISGAQCTTNNLNPEFRVEY
jgi:hypothetical protein